MHEYSLSTPEGLALMSLAEALLRVPDAATQDRLIEDKLGAGDWEHAAARDSESWLVSATTWALGLTARIVHPPETPEGIIRRLAQRLGTADGAHRRAPGDAPARPSVRARRDDRGRAVARRGTRGGRAIAIPSTCWARAPAPPRDAERYFESYANAIEAIGQERRRARCPAGPGISIKLSALHPRYVARQRERVLAELTPRLIELAVAAKAHDLNLTVDAEEADRLELSLEVFAKLLAEPGARRLGGARPRRAGLSEARAGGDRLARRGVGRLRPAADGAARQGRLLGHRDQARAGARACRISRFSRESPRPTSAISPARSGCSPRGRASTRSSPRTTR